MKAVRTLVAVCDDREARIFENLGVGKGLSELAAFSSTDEVRHGSDYADRPGRGQAAPGVAGHGFERKNDEHAQARASFAKEIVANLERLSGGTADRLGLVAAPAMLGTLRKALPPELQGKLVWDVQKDLVKLDARALVEHLSAVASF